MGAGVGACTWVQPSIHLTDQGAVPEREGSRACGPSKEPPGVSTSKARGPDSCLRPQGRESIQEGGAVADEIRGEPESGWAALQLPDFLAQV